MSSRRRPVLLSLVAATLLLTPATAQVRVGEVVPYEAATPDPYPAGLESMPAVWTDDIRAPGATFVRIHFAEMDLAPGDQVVISDPAGRERHVYTGRGPKNGEPFWALSVEGDRAIVTLHAGGEGGRGYVIDRIGEGLEPEATEVICGASDGRRDVACFGGSRGKRLTRPVARVRFMLGTSFFVCTGVLVRGASASTMITNNHCVADQATVDTVEATFNYQFSTCGGDAVDPFFKFAGDRFLRTSGALDYTLLTLQNDPEGFGAGSYVPTTLDPVTGAAMVFPQHPGGREKVAGWFLDFGSSATCKVGPVRQSIPGFTAGSQFVYACDSEGGSSGSPILNPQNGHMFGLHHLGNTSVASCSNGATHMSDICVHAGGLLNCAVD